MMVPMVTALRYYFNKYRTMAYSLTSVGCSSGLLLFPVLITSLSNTYSWRGTLIIISGLILNIMVCAALMRPTLNTQVREERLSNMETAFLGSHLSFITMQQDSRSTNHDQKLFHFEVFTNRPCIFLFLCIFMRGIAVSIIYVHLAAFFVSLGLDGDIAMVLIGIGQTVSRITIGLLITRFPKLVFPAAFVTVAVCALLSFVFPSLSHLGALMYVFAGCHGFFSGFFDALWSPLCENIAGSELLCTAVGVTTSVSGVAGMVGPPIAGTALQELKQYYVKQNCNIDNSFPQINHYLNALQGENKKNLCTTTLVSFNHAKMSVTTLCLNTFSNITKIRIKISQPLYFSPLSFDLIIRFRPIQQN